MGNGILEKGENKSIIVLSICFLVLFGHSFVGGNFFLFLVVVVNICNVLRYSPLSETERIFFP